jgi:hypothetical protein
LNPQEFVAKWRQIQLKEIATAQSHFNDVCTLVDHPPPLEDCSAKRLRWPHTLTDEQILEHLLALNLERAS